MFTLSPEGFRSSSDPSLDRYQLFPPLHLTSVDSVPSALKSTFNNTIPFAPARHSPLFHPACPIYLGEIRREDSRRASIPFRIRIYEKSSRNSFRIRTSKTQDLKSFRIRTYEKTPGGGVLLLTRNPTKDFCPEPALCVPMVLRDDYRESGISPMCGSRAHCPAQLSNLPTFKHFNAAFPLPTSHHPLLTVFQRTSTLPPLIYGIIPPHRGNASNSVRKRGGIGD
jgi:hypothetical protein